MTTEQQIDAIVRKIMSPISVPMDTRAFGGTYSGLLLGSRVLCTIERAAREALIKDFAEQGEPMPVRIEDIENDYERMSRLGREGKSHD